MARVRFHPFVGGLWVAGPAVLTPPNTLRRAKGLHAVRTTSARTRMGSTKVTSITQPGSFDETSGLPLAPHSVYAFGDQIYYGVGEVLGDGSPNDLVDALSGERLTFVEMLDSYGAEDRLYVVGGGELFSIGRDGAIHPWGVAPPPRGMLAVVERNRELGVFHLDNVTFWRNWTGEIRQFDPRTIEVTFPNDRSTISWESAGLPPSDFTVFPSTGTDPQLQSTDGDYIEFDFWTSRMVTLNSVSIQLCTDSENFFLRTFTSKGLPPSPFVGIGAERTIDAGGFVDNARFTQFLNQDLIGEELNKGTRVKVQTGVDKQGNPVYEWQEVVKKAVGGVSTVEWQQEGWQVLRATKASFSKFGNPDWSNITYVRFVMTRQYGDNKPWTYWRGNVRLVGGAPITGTVRYKLTEVNEVTGAESNPNESWPDVQGVLGADVTAIQGTIPLVDASEFPNEPTLVRIDDEYIVYTSVSGNNLIGCVRDAVDEITGTGSTHKEGANVAVQLDTIAPNVDRSAVFVTSIPVTTGKKRLYRTMGNQSTYFLCDELDGDVVTYIDRVADFQNLETVSKVLDTKTLDFDNVKPEGTYRDAAGPFEGRMWWARDSAAPQRISYSPGGRPESVAGFLEPTSEEDEIQKLVVWNGALYALSSRSIFQIFGQTEPFQIRRLSTGCGTIRPHTVVPTPLGILYQGQDGIRLFDGQTSQLIGFDAVGPLFRGESSEGIDSFDGVVATFARSEYLVSDGSTILAFNTMTQTWREIGGLEVGSLYYDAKTDRILGGIAGKILAVEDPASTTDDGVAIPFLFQTAHVGSGTDATLLVQRVYIECNPKGQQLTPVLVADDREIPLADFTGQGLQLFEMSVNVTCRRFGIRISGLVTQMVEFSRIEADVYEAGR